jgi:NADH-quinone oxidoreductase subunit N
MDLSFLKLFLAELFFSFAVFTQLLFNLKLVVNQNNNFPIIDKEIFFQSFLLLFCLLLIISKNNLCGYSDTLILLNNYGGMLLKLFFILMLTLSFNLFSRAIIFQKLNFFENYTLFLISSGSLFFLINANDFIIVYLLIEIQALCFYVLVCIKRNSAFSTEASLKYFILGCFTSGFFICGCSFIYASLGTLNFTYINFLLFASFVPVLNDLSSFNIVGVLFIIIALFFKLAVVPFHFWMPDAYEGAPLSTTIVISVLPKIIIFYLLVKIINCFSLSIDILQYLYLLVGMLSIFLAAFFALRQKRLKRLFIYSSIGQVGFLMCGLAANSLDGYTNLFFFLYVYCLSSFLIWGIFVELYGSNDKINSFEKSVLKPLVLSSISNYFKNNKILAICLSIAIFSLAGIPPLTGFISKILIIVSLLKSNFVVQSVFIVILSIFSVFYYLRLLKVVFFDTKKIIVINKKFQTTYNTNFNIFSFCILLFFAYLILSFLFISELLYFQIEYIILETFSL